MQNGKLSLLIALFVFICTSAFAQSAGANKKGVLYAGFGTNLSFYSKSDISLRGLGNPLFDFTLHNVRGKDDGGLKYSNGAPQYSLQLGYYSFIKKWGIEFNFDHIKYYVRQNQLVHLTGSIDNIPYNIDTTLTKDFVKLEHSDGANYALFKLVKWQPLIKNAQNNTLLNLILKAGAGPVVPKTNSTIMGKHWDDRYKIAGYVLALEGGLRYNVCKYVYAEGNAKGAYANYSHFLIADGSGRQQWFGLHFSVLLGVQF